MKTVLYIWRSMALLAGIERTLSSKINWLASHGFKVLLITYEQGPHPIILPLHPNVIIIDLKTPFYSLSRYPLYIRYYKYLQMKSIFYKRLRDVVIEYRPDIVLTIAGCMNVIKEIYKACHNSKMIIESHETFFSVIKEPMYMPYPFLHYFARLYDNLNLRFVNRFDRMVCLTRGDAKEWRKHISTKIEVIPNPLKYIPFSLKQKTTKTLFRIISVGRLEEVKGFDRLIKAFSMIEDKCTEWRIDIFGKGSCEDDLRKLIAYYRLEDRISIQPPTNDIFTEYLNSDFYVLTSYHEGLGMVLLEAMACGIPCVSFNCDYGPREIIVNGETGLLVEDGDVEKLAKAILWMMEHPEERFEMGKKACEVTKKYQIDAIMPSWINLFNDL